MAKICIESDSGYYLLPNDAVSCIDGTAPKDTCTPSASYLDEWIEHADNQATRDIFRQLPAGALAAAPLGRAAQIAVKVVPKIGRIGGSLLGFEVGSYASRQDAFRAATGESTLLAWAKAPYAWAEDAAEWVGITALKGGAYGLAQSVVLADRLLKLGITCEGSTQEPQQAGPLPVTGLGRLNSRQ